MTPGGPVAARHAPPPATAWPSLARVAKVPAHLHHNHNWGAVWRSVRWRSRAWKGRTHMGVAREMVLLLDLQGALQQLLLRELIPEISM
mmetsp:Transcript_148805/g.476556  ORF Transcript_148805/g.476556 Transcript_148805/m.476556 type:complete len:89 (+) Transcript_148805:130-396(+)